MIKQCLIQLRPMRVVLVSLALLTLVFKAPSGTEISYEGWDFILTVILPVMAPLFFMVLLLDTLIATIWFTQTKDAEHRRYRLIIIVNLVTASLLVLFWLPFFIEALS